VCGVDREVHATAGHHPSDEDLSLCPGGTHPARRPALPVLAAAGNFGTEYTQFRHLMHYYAASLHAAMTPIMGKFKLAQESEIGEQKSGIAKFTLDIDKQSTTIWLWINWVQHLRLCLIQPGGP
jgi:hypothetical protein